MLRKLLAAGVALLLQFGAVYAHDLPVSELKLVADKDRLHLEIMLNAWELQFFNELDADKNGLLNPQELKGPEEQIARRIVESLDLRVAGAPVTADIVGIVPDYNTHHLTIRAHYPVDAAEATVEVGSRLAALTSAAHIVNVTLQRAGETERASISNSDSVARFRGSRAIQEVRSGSEATRKFDAGAGPLTANRVCLALVVAIALAGALLMIRHKLPKAHP